MYELQTIDLRLFDGGAEAAGETGADPSVACGDSSLSEREPLKAERAAAAPEDAAREHPGRGSPERGDPAREIPETPAARRARAAHAFAVGQSARWAAEGSALRAREPDFDLDAMRGDPVFALLLTHGVPMERAWRASTVDERVSQAAARAEKAVTDHIRVRGARPAEAGSGAAVCAVRPDAARLSDSEVLDVLARLARHERVSFG